MGQDEHPHPHASSCLNFFKEFRIKNAAAIATIKITIRVCILFHQKPEGGSKLKDDHGQTKGQQCIKRHGKHAPFPGARFP